MVIISFLIALLCFGIHLFFTKQLRTRKYIIEILLSYLIFFGLGINSVICFIAHVFFPYSTAQLIGWEGGTTFQFEVGIANLAFGILAMLCIFIRMKHFWMATIIGYTIFLWGAAVGHIRQMIISNNFSSGNAGIYFYHDVIYPFIIIGLFIWLILIKKEKLL